MRDEYPAVIPMISYEDGPAAMDWLADAFGFRERVRMLDRTGRLSHGEMQTADGVIMLASPTPEYESPRRHRESCDRASAWSKVSYIVDGVLVYVPDVQAHYEHARERGARILTDVETDENGKRYRTEDVEGHRWMFMER
jgi:PhnB protein